MNSSRFRGAWEWELNHATDKEYLREQTFHKTAAEFGFQRLTPMVCLQAAGVSIFAVHVDIVAVSCSPTENDRFKAQLLDISDLGPCNRPTCSLMTRYVMMCLRSRDVQRGTFGIRASLFIHCDHEVSILTTFDWFGKFSPVTPVSESLPHFRP